MADQMHGSTGVLFAVVQDECCDSLGLESIVPMHHEVQRVPWAKPAPVFDMYGEFTTGCCKSGGDPIINGTAAFDSGEDEYESAVEALCRTEFTVISGSEGSERREAKSGGGFKSKAEASQPFACCSRSTSLSESWQVFHVLARVIGV